MQITHFLLLNEKQFSAALAAAQRPSWPVRAWRWLTGWLPVTRRGLAKTLGAGSAMEGGACPFAASAAKLASKN